MTGTIKIVSSLPRTGSSKGQTDTIVNAMKMALDEVGMKVGGATIVYEDMDDATPARGAWDAGKEAENANKAVADADVMVYVGTFNSGAAKVAIPILNRANLVMISPANTYPGLTKPGKGEPNEPDVYYPGGKRNYARVVPADDLQGAVGANWAKQIGATKVYILDDTELYGHGIAVVFAETANEDRPERRRAARGHRLEGVGLPGAGDQDPRDRRRHGLLRRHHPEQRRQAVQGSPLGARHEHQADGA